jgi:hypothetical protein
MFLFGPFLLWFPPLFIGAAFACALLGVVGRTHPGWFTAFRARVPVRTLIRATVVFRVGFALFLTYGQYYVWSQSTLTQSLLHSPLDPATMPFWLVRAFPWIFNTDLGYLFFYSWGRFWLNALLSIAVAALFFWYLRMLERRNARFFEEGEPELGFLMALLVGWPDIVVFVPFVFLAVVLTSVFRGTVLRQPLTTLGWPFLIAALVTLTCGGLILDVCGLVVLAV